MLKSCIAVVLFLSVVFRCDAQQDYLVLIDAESNQPFYARLGEQTFSSSAVGHLSIPHLKDSVYSILIGFPQNRFPEQRFSIKVNKKDEGFRLRKMGEKGWALYNWQTQELKMPLIDTGTVANLLELGVKKEDAFSRLMADVVNDSLVMYNTFTPEPGLQDTAKKTVEPVAIFTDTALKTVPPPAKSEVVNTGAESALVKKGNQATREAPINKTTIIKLKSVRLTEGWRLTFIDKGKGGPGDTIQLIIPYDIPPTPVANTSAPRKDSVISIIQDTSKLVAPPVVKTQPAVVNPACKEIASDYDIDVMRVSVITADTQEKKIAAAKKSLKSKCVTVKQIRALSELFVSDGTRYEFFEAMYPAVQDRGNFPQLADLLIDRGYNSKFKAGFEQ